MSVKIYDTMTTASDGFPLAYAEKINIKKTDGSEDNLQSLYDNGELGGNGTASNIQTLTQEEYDALDPQEQLEGEFYCYDSARHFRNGVEYGKAVDISGKQDNLNQIKFTIRRNSVNEPRYCMIASSDLSQNLLMCEPYRFKGIFGSSTESVEKKSLIDLYVSFREGAIADKVMKGYADSSEAFDYVDLIITVDETENRSYAYVDFLTSGSMCTGEITVPSLDAEKYMTLATSFELVDSMKGTELCKMSDYCKVITEIDDVNDPSETSVWSSKKTSDAIDEVNSNLGELEKNVKFDADDLNTVYVPNKTITVRTNKNTKNLPPSSMVNFLVTSFAYIEGQYYRITQYCYENSENLSYEMYVRRGTSNAGESSITWSAWQELATMDKVALKQECFNKKVTLTDSNWKYETITFEKNYNNTPSVNVSCGDYLNIDFYSYWGCETHIININNKGCTIRYRSSKASASEPLENLSIIVCVNGI